MAGERGRLAGDALLQVAVARDHVDEVVERARARRGVRVEQAALVARGVGEADGRGEALAERAGGDLDAVGVAVLGVAGGLRAPGAQRLEVVELEAEAREVQLHVLRQRAVAGREDEPVAAEPGVVGRVVAHDLLEQQVRRGREAHRRAGVAVAHLLDGVRREHASRVHRPLVDGFPLQICHELLFLPIVKGREPCGPDPPRTFWRGSATRRQPGSSFVNDSGENPRHEARIPQYMDVGGLCDGLCLTVATGCRWFADGRRAAGGGAVPMA